MTEKKIILGIDPGTNILGFGVVSVHHNKVKLVDMGIIKTSPKLNHYQKLNHIFEELQKVFETYNPNEVALEAPFYGKNVQSMLKLGRAQGVVMAIALKHNCVIAEYAPLRVKQSITGMGTATKEQVAFFLQQIFRIKEMPKQLDATDAVAVAVCHHLSKSSTLRAKTTGGWDDFVRKNPTRIKK